MLERGSVGVRRNRIAPINVWIAATLLQPRTAAASVVAAIAITRLINLFSLLLMKPAESLWVDCTEAYAWGQQFLLGYGRHPPVTGWIARIWYGVFPAANWSSYALSQVMISCSLISIYLIGERVLGRRRATLVVFVMMLYPIYIAAKSDRFDNTQVLLAILPLTIWLFLRAYEKPTLLRGCALGVAAAAVMLTYYSASFGLAGLAIAAVLVPGRWRFFSNPAPYAAVIVLVLAVIPHVLWLAHNDFSTLRWIDSHVGSRWRASSISDYLGQHFGFLAFCLVGAAVALWPWRFRKAIGAPPASEDRAIVAIVAAILVFGPALLALALKVPMQLYWGDSLFFLVPIAVASFLPMILVTRRAIVVSVWVAAVFTFAQLLSAPVYSWARFKIMPDDGLIARSAKQRSKSPASGASGSIRLCQSSPATSTSLRRSCSTVPTIQKCSPISIRSIRPGSTFPTSSFTKAMSAFASMKALFMTPTADGISRNSIPMPSISKSNCNGGRMGWSRRR